MAAASANAIKSAEAKLKVLEKDLGELGKQVSALEKDLRRSGDNAALEKVVKSLHATSKDLQQTTGKLEQRVKYLTDTALKSSKDISGMAALVKKQHQDLGKQLDTAEKAQTKDKAVIAKLIQVQAKTRDRAEALAAKAAAKDKKDYEQDKKQREQEQRQRDKLQQQQMDKLKAEANAEAKKAVKESEKMQKEQMDKAMKSVVDARLKILEAQVAGLLRGR